MDFISRDIENYCQRFSKPEEPLLNSLNRETNLKVMNPRMLSGHIQGSFLSMISCMLKPARILEIGTYTGYSAICLAQGLAENGKLITLDCNMEIESMARRYFKESGFENKIDFRTGDATKIIPSLSETFDLVFIDADKENYAVYYDLVFDKVKKGGFILADNVLWSGKVLQKESEMDEDTRALHDFNKKVCADERVENLVLPLRDGIMMCRKK
jgi:caffeoyl-CoA O-methyltransferase